MNLARVTLLVMALSGGLAALAGVCEVAGMQGQLKRGLSPDYGYTAIIVAWLARLHPWATIMVSILLGGLLVGSDMLQIAMNLPVAVAYMLQGLILFSLLSVEFLLGSLRWGTGTAASAAGDWHRHADLSVNDGTVCLHHSGLDHRQRR
jgi:ABC-type uncharacterized transport system permease subunit